MVVSEDYPPPAPPVSGYRLDSKKARAIGYQGRKCLIACARLPQYYPVGCDGGHICLCRTASV